MTLFYHFRLAKAIIYCRVSSKKQVREGHGLSSQESTCRKFAADKNIEVVQVFSDDFTGGGDFWNRPGIRALLKYLDGTPEPHAVIFDDVKRFARDTLFHLKLRKELSARDATPLCPTFRFEDSPEGEFVETVIAATAQLERKQNRRQVIRRMKARLEAGYWVFAPPLGYRFSTQGGSKRLVPDRGVSKWVTQALEGFAERRLPRQCDVAHFLQRTGCYSRWSRGSTLSIQKVERFLKNEIYSGWCVSPKWKVRVRGHHKALISEATYRRIQKRLTENRTTVVRRLFRSDFPLRGYTHCLACKRPLTSCWTQGRNSRYPYYRCQTRGCLGSIHRNRMEAQFQDRLVQAVPRPGMADLLLRMLEEAYTHEAQIAQHDGQVRTERLKEISQELGNLVDAIAKTPHPEARSAYEARLIDLQAERESLEELGIDKEEFGITPLSDTARELLTNPLQYWADGDLERRRQAQELVFTQPIWYDKNAAYYTARFSPVYALFETSKGDEGRLVDLLRSNLHPVAEELQRWTKFLKNAVS